MASIKIVSGANQGESFPLDARETLLGRHPECQVVFKDSTVSRRHARIVKDAQGYTLDDIGSQHGTRVNGEPIRAPYRLQDRDEIQLSQVKLVFLEGTTDIGAGEPTKERSSTIITSVDVLGIAKDDSHNAPRWRALLEITRSLGVSLDLREILPKVLVNILQILPKASRGCIMVAPRPQEPLQPYAVKDLRGRGPALAALSRTISKRVMSEGKAIVMSQENEPAIADSVVDMEMYSVVCAPLIGSADKPFGLIHLDSQDPKSQFTSDDLDILVNIANLVGQAVDHSRLHETQLQFDRRERDLETARQVQQHFLPQAPPEIPGYQLAQYYKPVDAVGGDYFGYTRLPDGQLAIAVGDVAGKGVPAALLMARLCSEARYCLVTDIIPSDAVCSLNQQLSRQRYSFFITYALCVLDPVRHELTVVNAGHMPPMLRRARTSEVEDVGATVSSPPLGIDPSLTYRQTTVKLEPGDVVMMYTDGVSDCPNPGGAHYGIERIRQVTATARDANDLVNKLLADVQAFGEGLPPEDDTCIVAFSRNSN